MHIIIEIIIAWIIGDTAVQQSSPPTQLFHQAGPAGPAGKLGKPASKVCWCAKKNQKKDIFFCNNILIYLLKNNILLELIIVHTWQNATIHYYEIIEIIIYII